MNKSPVEAAINPLRQIFWGAVLCVVDVTVSQRAGGQGFKLDLLDDAVGTVLIFIGVSALRKIPVHDRYSTVMRFVQIVSFLAILDAIRDHFILRDPDAFAFLGILLSLTALEAIIAFCIAMRWFSDSYGLTAASRSWSVTTTLFQWIYWFPLGLLYSAQLAAILTGRSFRVDLGPAGLLLVPVFMLPLIHFFVSTSRMRQEAEAATAA